MHLLAKLQLCLTALLASNALAALVVTPGGAEDIVITDQNTVNATAVAAPVLRFATSSKVSTSSKLQLSLANNLDSDSVNAYVTGLDTNGLLVMLQPDGSWYYPSASTTATTPQEITASVAIPLGAQGSTTNITLPGYISSGRIYFADGCLKFYTVRSATGAASLVEPSAVNPSDPSAGVNWGFAELTYTQAGGIYVNVSYVDFVGLPIGIDLINTSGAIQSAEGVDAGAVQKICAELAEQADCDGEPWDQLCMADSSGTYLRALSPTQYMSISSTAFADYWTSYVNQVWAHYTTTPLTINTQVAAGLVNCTVSGYDNLLYCAGDNRGYAKPTASDIVGCNGGPFAIQSGDNAIHYAVVPRLCAAFHRTTFLLHGGNVQPALGSGSYYTVEPTNFYSAIVHDYEVDGKGYAFAYDDVTPTGDVNDSGLLADANPALLTVTVGGPMSSNY